MAADYLVSFLEERQLNLIFHISIQILAHDFLKTRSEAIFSLLLFETIFEVLMRWDFVVFSSILL